MLEYYNAEEHVLFNLILYHMSSKTEYLKKIDKYLSKINLTASCSKGTTTFTKIHIDIVKEEKGVVIFYLKGNNTIDIGYARFQRAEAPYLSMLDPKNDFNEGETYFGLSYLDICYKGTGLGSLLLFYGTEYIFHNNKDIIQIQLDDDSDYGVSNDPALRAKAIYQQHGFYRSDTVKKHFATGEPIPDPNVSIGQEHFIPRNNIHGLIGWNQKRDGLFLKIETKLKGISTNTSSSIRKSSQKRMATNQIHKKNVSAKASRSKRASRGKRK